jgi:serine/threonine-protein kinase
MGLSLSLHLVDSATGHVVQTWRFMGRQSAVIGRGVDADVRLADTSVSRRHVEFILNEAGDQWSLRSVGRNGTFVNGERVEDFRLSDRTTFQLGSAGPKFLACLDQQTLADQETLLSGDASDGLEFLTIDEGRKRQEIQQIVEGDHFRSLQEKARLLRNQKSVPPTEERPIPNA